MPKAINNFFAILKNGDVRKISLSQSLTAEIRNTFLKGEWMIDENTVKVQFDGQLVPREEEVVFVKLELPDNITEAVKNPIGTKELDLKEDEIKTIFWYQDEKYYFQNFDSRKLLRNKSVLFFGENTYNKLSTDAFIVDEIVNAIHVNGELLFTSYANANKIFSLVDFFEEATNDDLEEFANLESVSIDKEWLLKNVNVTLRKLITYTKKSGVLTRKLSKKIINNGKSFDIQIIQENGKITFPKKLSECRALLEYLNDQYYEGLVSGKKFRTNSKAEYKSKVIK